MTVILYSYHNSVQLAKTIGISMTIAPDRSSTANFYMLSLLWHLVIERRPRKRRVAIIIGAVQRYWLNWCWSVERFGGGWYVFGATVQLSAATRDFPLHGHLHASQTPKGCSFTRPPPVGWPSGWHEVPVAWVKSRDGGCGAAGGLETDGVQLPKQTYDLNRSNLFSGWRAAWKIATEFPIEGPTRVMVVDATVIPRLVNSKHSPFFQRNLARIRALPSTNSTVRLRSKIRRSRGVERLNFYRISICKNRQNWR